MKFEPLHVVAFFLGGVTAVAVYAWRALHVPQRKALT